MSKRNTIQSPKAPPALGPYSQAVIAGGFLYISGQLGIDAAAGALVETSKEEQIQQIFRNVGYILEEAGCGFDDVVKCTGFLTDMNDFPLFNTVIPGILTLRSRPGLFLRSLPFPKKEPLPSWK